MARVLVTRTAREALATLDLLFADAVLDALGELERDPHLGHRLRGRVAGLRSYRVGVYRIIYELRDDTTVRVVAIRHRGARSLLSSATDDADPDAANVTALLDCITGAYERARVGAARAAEGNTVALNEL